LVGCGDDDDDESGNGTASTSTGTAGTGTAAVTGTSAGLAKAGGRLVVVAAGDPHSIDPHRSTGGADHQYFWTIFDNLVNYNKQAELDESISLAQSWEVVDGTRINFKLRPAINFHDGTPFNAEAVKINIERGQDESIASVARPALLPITKVEVTDEHSVSFILDEPNSALLANLGDRAGTIFSPAAIEKFGEDTGRNPVGTGPFMFKEWLQADHVSVVRNPDYWGKDADGSVLPYLDEVRWNVVPDAGVAVANLETGDADIVSVSAIDAGRLESNDDYQIDEFVGTNWWGFYINQALPPMDDVHFRRAVAFACDKAALIQALTNGKSPPGVSLFTPASWAFNPAIKAIDFNLDEARRELAQSKYPDGASFEALTATQFAQMTELQKQMLAELNIDVTITPVTTAEMAQRMFFQKNVQTISASLSLHVEPDSQASQGVGSQGLYNPGALPNAEVDGLIVKARQTYDREERKGYYDQIAQLAVDQVFHVYSFYGVAFTAARKRVQNLDTLVGAEGKQRYKTIWLS
jgi:ABC-type transport system substrate-binding protein